MLAATKCSYNTRCSVGEKTCECDCWIHETNPICGTASTENQQCHVRDTLWDIINKCKLGKIGVRVNA